MSNFLGGMLNVKSFEKLPLGGRYRWERALNEKKFRFTDMILNWNSIKDAIKIFSRSSL